MADYLGFSTLRGAMDRSRQEWEKVLGGPKRDEDVTEFLWGWIEHPNQNRVGDKAALVVTQDSDRLSAAEQLTAKKETLMRAEGWIRDES